MREIDTEAPVEWPAWCYSANTQDSAIDVISRKGDLASDLIPATSPSSYIQSSSTTILPISSSGSSRNRTRRKNPYTQSLTAATSPGAYNNSTASHLSTTTSIPSLSPSTEISAASEKLQQHLQLSSFLINKKMLSERILMGFGSQSVSDSSNINSNNCSTNSSSSSTSSNNNNNNSSNNNNNSSSKRNCDSNTTTISVYDKIKNEAQMMDPTTASVVGSSHMKNGDLNLSTKNSGSSSNSGVNSGMANSTIKKERLSPTANGDVQSAISRSRSATPSSFPGTPPQSTHSSDLTNQTILNQSRSNEFQARNYSDFMRSLAAKYNNTNSNDNAAARSLFFDSQKYTSGSAKPTHKESPSPPEAKRQSLPTPPQVPFVPPLFPGLPFPTTVFPPLIDMSSTQALVTLARAAKEAELQNILRSAQKRPGTTGSSQSLSPSLRSVLTPTTQSPLVQFNPQSFMLPTNFQAPQRSPSAPSPRNSISPQQYRGEPSSAAGIPAATSASGSGTASIKRSSSPPLDLSSSQHSKRHKVESPSPSPSASPPLSSSVEKNETKPESPKESQTTSNPVSSGSSGGVAAKRSDSPASGDASRVEFPRHCRSQSDEISSWTVNDVCNFVNSIDICAEYSQKFRDQCIDGSGLPLLTEEHLTNSLGMKLGPALKLRSILAKKLGGPCPCVSCTTLLQQQQQQQQQQLLHQQQSTLHPIPSRLGTPSTTLSSSASTSHTGLSTSSSCAATANPNAINNSSNSLSNSNNTSNSNSSSSSSNNNNINSSNTANCSIRATSPSAETATNLSINNSNPARPASADSGS